MVQKYLISCSSCGYIESLGSSLVSQCPDSVVCIFCILISALDQYGYESWLQKTFGIWVAKRLELRIINIMITESNHLRYTSEMFVQLNHIWYTNLGQIKEARSSREITFVRDIVKESRDEFKDFLYILEDSCRTDLVWVANYK